MAKNRQKHLTASGKLKPSVRLARRNMKSRRVTPTNISAEWANKMQQSFSDLLAMRKREKEFLEGLSLNFDPITPVCYQSELLKPSCKAWNRHWPIGNVGLDIAMFFAVKHRCKSLWLKLKKSFYARSHAVCTQVYRLVRRIERMLGAIHDGSLSVPMQFVLVKVSRLFFHLSQFLFEVTFAIGHRRMLLLEREALALDVHQAFVHVADDFDD